MNKITQNRLYKWSISWIKLLKLNWPYYWARCCGYKYYIPVQTALTMSKNTATPGQIRTEMKELGANVLVVRWVRRINARSFGFWHFAVFKNIESALIFKLSEDVDELKKFESFFNPLKIK